MLDVKTCITFTSKISIYLSSTFFVFFTDSMKHYLPVGTHDCISVTYFYINVLPHIYLSVIKHIKCYIMFTGKTDIREGRPLRSQLDEI